jgi:AAA domain
MFRSIKNDKKRRRNIIDTPINHPHIINMNTTATNTPINHPHIINMNTTATNTPINHPHIINMNTTATNTPINPSTSSTNITPLADLTEDPPSVEQIVSSYRHLDNVSEEQLYICNSVEEGKNVIVDACAGSGKSTTVLSTCRFMPQTNFLILTFNRALRFETREKVNHLNITNAEVHTYHSLAVLYYDKNAHTDNQLMNVINNEKPLLRKPKKLYDIIVIDEAQDMSRIYYDFIKKFTCDLNHPFLLLVLGDYRQCLYEFKGSDVRYLTRSEFLWKNNPLLKNPDDWVYASLKTTYRLTNQMAYFVNNVLLGEQKLNACRNGPPVKYFVSTFNQIPDEVFGFIYRIVKTEKSGKYDDFFILSPSIKKSELIKKIENKLVANNIPCHIPLIEDSEMDERVIENKVVFCTFHSSKGRQRKYVIVLNFDNTYFDYIASNKPRNICPNTIYVATTRATHQMYIYEQIRYKKNENPQKTIYSFDFLKLDHPEIQSFPANQYIEFINNVPSQIPKYTAPTITNGDKEPLYNTSPTDLTKFLSYKVIETIFPIIDTIWQLEYKDPVEIFIPNIIQTSTGYEDVCDLNGIVIPLIYYDWHYNSNASVLRRIINSYLSDKTQPEFFIKQNIINAPEFCNTSDDYLYLANITQTIKDKLHFRLKQINNNGYNWLTQNVINTCINRLYYFIPPKNNPFKIEESIINQEDEHYHNIDKILENYFGKYIKFRFNAIVDIITDRTIWELKCTNDISFEHKIQVVVYAWIWRLTYESTSTTPPTPPKIFRILNIKTGEVWKLNATIEQLTTIMVVLLQKLVKDKLHNDIDENDDDDDNEFINMHL